MVTDDNKPREWWIFPRPFVNGITQIYSIKQEGYTESDQLYVIEHSAFAALKERYEQACEDERFQLEIAELKRQIDGLKEHFVSKTEYDDQDAEISKLEAELKAAREEIARLKAEIDRY